MKKKRSFIKIFAILLTSLASLVLVGIFTVFLYARFNIDFSVDEALFESARKSSITRLYYDSDFSDSEYTAKELALVTPAQGKKSWYSYDDIGENLKVAFITVEDQKFFDHSGVDVKRTAYALLNHIFKFRDRFGASTITQQVIKNISGDDEQTITRKFEEIIRAYNIEKTHTKEEIFEVYLNIVPMGEGIVGVGYASEFYFGKTPDNLTYAEAATLVGITNAPTKYNPIKNKDACLTKRNSILLSLFNNGAISSEEYETAINTELEIICDGECKSQVNSWFVETVLDDVSCDLAKKLDISESAARLLIMNGGYSIYTTENPAVQNTLEEYFENPDNFPSDISRGLNYSMVILNEKGDLVGIVGAANRKEGNRLLNHATVPHTPGSSIKPIALYATAIDEKLANWATVFDDFPVSIKKNDEGEYSVYPKNSPAIYDGYITLADALRLSKNTVAVRLYNIIGKEKIWNRLKNDFGFSSLVERLVTDDGRIITDKAVSPLALGQLSYGVSLRELTEAYTTFTNGGALMNARSYIAVYSSDGDLVLNNEKIKKQIYSRETAEIMTEMLARVVESGTAKAITLDELVDTAGKTGTSGGDKDRLFVGYTPYYTAGIWCGFDKSGESIGNQSVSHLEIWDDIMCEIHEELFGSLENIKSFVSSSVERLPYCKDSGKLYYDTCAKDERGSRLEYGYFTRDNKPEGVCDVHMFSIIDKETGMLATENTPPENIIIISLLDRELRNPPIEIRVSDENYFIVARRDEDSGVQAYIYEEADYWSVYKKRRSYSKSAART